MVQKERVTFSPGRSRPASLLYFSLWYLLPWPFYLIAWLATGSSSYLVLRYFIIYLVPTCLFAGWLISCIGLPRLKIAWVSLFLLFNFGLYLLPVFGSTGRFSSDRQEDWRGVIHFIERNCQNNCTIFLRSGLIESDLVLNSSFNNSMWIGLISCPFGDFYTRLNLRIVDLPYHWSGSQAENYFSEKVNPLIRENSEFWLVVRKDAESGKFLSSFRQVIQRGSISSLREEVFPERYGIDLFRFSKSQKQRNESVANSEFTIGPNEAP